MIINYKTYSHLNPTLDSVENKNEKNLKRKDRKRQTNRVRLREVTSTDIHQKMRLDGLTT